MPELDFQVESAATLPHAMAPHLNFRLRIVDRAPAEHTTVAVTLQCQIRIEPVRRSYSAEEQQELFELFGAPADWSRSLQSLLWTHASVSVPAFAGRTAIDLPVPCTYDFNIAAAKYFRGLSAGEVPLCLLFSGTQFVTDPQGRLQVGQIGWDREAKFRLPIATWRDMMNVYYPNSTWLRVSNDVFRRVDEYKRRQALSGWEQALESLLDHAEEPVEP